MPSVFTDQMKRKIHRGAQIQDKHASMMFYLRERLNIYKKKGGI